MVVDISLGTKVSQLPSNGTLSLPTPVATARKVTPSLQKIQSLMQQHEEERRNGINLIVSENRMTEIAMAPLGTDIHSRYAASFYSGTQPAQNIIQIATDSAKLVFRAEYANLSPISGSLSLLSVIFGLTNPGDSVGRVPPFFPGGGYPLNYGVFDRVSLPLPFNEETWQIDLEPCKDLLLREKPKLVILGSSIVTYPMPVKEVAAVVHSYGGVLAYDGSHSLGLIAGGQYQDPLREGADILLGSTHKTFPGPQGGIVLTNNRELAEKVNEVSNFTPLNGPTFICNPHLDRIASTAIVLEETDFNVYAEQVVSNARVMADEFKMSGIPMFGLKAKNFPESTYCHQVITSYSREEAFMLRDRLKQFRINVDAFLRFGVSEITRLGYKEEATRELASIIATILNGEYDDQDINMRIDHLVSEYKQVVL